MRQNANPMMGRGGPQRRPMGRPQGRGMGLGNAMAVNSLDNTFGRGINRNRRSPLMRNPGNRRRSY